MKVLIIGSGGREHALSWKIARSPLVKSVYVAPGNGGTDLEPNIANVNISSDDIEGLSTFALNNKIDLTIVGPEDPLVNGITDNFTKKGLKCFGPTKNAARLEGSKEFMKKFLEDNQIPTAEYQSFQNIEEAVNYIEEKGCPIVIKADGLAAGKGVTIAHTIEEAKDAIVKSLESEIFGEAGKKIVIEEFLEGEEASFIVITDGKTAIPFASSQDHKARDDGDQGPNTGGMGAYSPAPLYNEKLKQKILNRIVVPTLQYLKAKKNSYKGILYVGLMIKNGDPYLIEYNVRMGDPECQTILPKLKTDLVDIFTACCEKKLNKVNIEWSNKKSICVVVCSKGYPDVFKKNEEIRNLDILNLEGNDFLFHAGTSKNNDKILAVGGRVLNFVSLSNDFSKAKQKIIKNIKLLNWSGGFYRSDIGYKVIDS